MEQFFAYSTSLNELNAALIAAKAQFDPVLKDTKNPFYNSKYADLNGLIEATESQLSSEGLVITQFPTGTETLTGVTTMLLHSSGQFIVGTLLLPANGKGKDNQIKIDAQTAGSAITYARRYAYKAILGLAEQDDDANSATGKPATTARPQSGTKPAKATQPKPEPTTAKPIATAAPEVPKAVIPAPPQANLTPVRPEPPEPDEPGATEPETQNVTNLPILPTNPELKAFYERAKLVAAGLSKAGMQPSNGVAVGAKLVKFITTKTGYETMPAIPKAQWEDMLNRLEAALTKDPATLIKIIEETI